MIDWNDDARADSDPDAAERLVDASSEARRASLAAVPIRAAPVLPDDRPAPRAMRPREKLFARGPGPLGLVELVTLVIGTGHAGQPASAIAERLVRRHGLRGLARITAAALAREPGMGRASATRLVAAFELGGRASGGDPHADRPRLSRPGDAFRHVADLGRARKEHLVGLYLDAQNGLIHRETISIGSLNTTRTHPREILFPAVVHLALGFILAHNHPSGSLDPSEEDVAFTQAVRRAGELMGIELYDHIIVARGRYVSLRERGLL